MRFKTEYGDKYKEQLNQGPSFMIEPKKMCRMVSHMVRRPSLLLYNNFPPELNKNQGRLTIGQQEAKEGDRNLLVLKIGK